MTGPADSTTPPDAASTGNEASFQVARRSEPDRVELVLHGELDINTMPTAQREIEAAQDEGPAVLVLDLAALDFLDSSGVRLVLLAQHHADDTGRHVAVRLGDGHARRLFDTLGVTSRLDVLDVDDGRT